MPEMVEYPLQDGGSVLVAVDVATDPGVTTRGWSEERSRRVEARADETLEATLAKIRPAADALLTSLSGLKSTPHEVAVEFSVQLTAQAGVCIATVGSSSNFRITLTWRPQG